MYQWLWKYAKPWAFKMAIALILCLASVGMSVAIAPLSGQIVDKVIRGGQKNLLPWILGLMFGLTLGRAAIRYAFQMTFERASQGIIKKMREDLYHLLMGMDMEYFDRTKTGELMSFMTGDLEAIRHFHAWVIYQLFENSLVFVISLVILFSTNWLLTLILCSLVPFIGWAAWALSQEVKPAFAAIREQFSKLNSMVQEYIAGNRVVKAFAREDFEETRFAEQNDSFRDKQIASALIWGKYIPIIEFLSGCLMAVMISIGGILIVKGKLTLGELVVFSGLTWAITGPLRMSGWLINDYRRFTVSLDRVFGLSRLEARVTSPAHPLTVTRIRGDLAVRNATLTLNGGRVLDGIDLEIEAGQFAVLLGPTGSGKTTLARLLARHLDPDSGCVLLDGRDLREYALGDVRRNVGMAMQEAFLYSDTIRNNIAFSNPLAPMADIKNAARLAMADAFIGKMPESWETVVGERGVGLSGGQRQRVSLARLLLASPPVMVLDDTTSAVDAETEAAIRESLATLRGKSTIIAVTHRLDIAEDADIVIVLEDGKISQRGTHETLLSVPGWYRDVWEHQHAAKAV